MFITLLHSRLSKVTSITLVACLLAHDIKPSSSDDQTFPAALLRAVQINDLNLVKALIASGTSVNTSPGGGAHNTPLREALLKGHEELTDYLLAHGAGIHAQDPSLQNTVFQLVREGHTMIAKRLLNQPDKPETHVDAIHHESGKTLLHEACMECKPDKARFLVEEVGADVNQADKNGRTALFNAAWEAHHATIEFLLGCGASVNHTDNDGCTALFYLSSLRSSTAQHLLEHGADPTITSKAGDTCLNGSIFSGDLETVKIILAKMSTLTSVMDPKVLYPFECIYSALGWAPPHMIDFIFSQGADPNTVNSQNKSLLQVAIEDCKDQSIAYLLGKKATVDSRTLTILKKQNLYDPVDRHTLLHAALGFDAAGQLEAFKSYISSAQWTSIKEDFKESQRAARYPTCPRSEAYLRRYCAFYFH